MIKIIELTGKALSIEDVITVARKIQPFQIKIEEKSKEKIEHVREYIEQIWLNENFKKPIYGFNTGVGALKNTLISNDQLDEFQKLYIKSHSVGVGDYFSIEIVRAALLLRINSFAHGNSGVRIELINKLIEMLDKDIHPAVPQRGSVGASGDLAPLSHIGAVLVGEPDAKVINKCNNSLILNQLKTDAQKEKTTVNDSKDYVKTFVVDDNNFETIELKAKEAMALTNGATFILATGTLLIHDAENLLKIADLCAAMSLEAMMCEKSAFDEKLNRLRMMEGQKITAENIRNLTEDSKRMTETAREVFFKNFNKKKGLQKEYKNRVQDRYSLRCIPQVHGASKDAFNYCKKIIKNEIDAVTDNPLIISDGEYEITEYSISKLTSHNYLTLDEIEKLKTIIGKHIKSRRKLKDSLMALELNLSDDTFAKIEVHAKYYKAISGGNFHGQPLAIPMDTLSIAISEIANISERRIFALINSNLSYELPDNLTGVQEEKQFGMNTGLMIAQYTAASLVSENKAFAHPSSVDSIPTSGNQEDHVSMGTIGARKAAMILKNAQYVLAIELLTAIQALHLSNEVVNFTDFPLSTKITPVFEKLKHEFPKIEQDIFLHPKIERMFEIITNQDFLGEFTENLKA